MYEMSYANLIMYSAVLPSYDSKDKDTKKKVDDSDKIINADDPEQRDEYYEFIKQCTGRKYERS